MRKKIFILLSLLCVLTACGSSEQLEKSQETNATPEENIEENAETVHSENWSAELISLMNQINEEHKSVKKKEIDLSLYDEYFQNGKTDFSNIYAHKNQYSEALTQEQALEDMDALFELLSERYALYQTFDGFNSVQEKMKKIILTQENWSKDELKNILIEHFEFIEDSHFYIGSTAVSTTLCPYFYREVKYFKNDDGIFTNDNKKVIAVEGFSDFEQLFKRSLTAEGDIVYYPIVFAKRALNEETAFLEDPAPQNLVVRYSDGNSDILSAENFNFYTGDDEEDNSITENNGISVLYAKETSSLIFSNTAKNISDKAVSIVDMTRNVGGDARFALQWWQNYLNTAVPNNFYAFYNADSTADIATEMICSFESRNGKQLSYTSEDDFIKNSNLLILLTGKKTASAAECFIDAGHNAEDILVIGENTRGCLSSNLFISEYLPNSGLRISYGNAVYVFPDGYFSECYGLEPDLWCPASEAQEAALNFIEKNIRLEE